MRRLKTIVGVVAITVLLGLSLGSCSPRKSTPATDVRTASPTTAIVHTNTPLPPPTETITPTFTPEPLVAVVNGEPITLAEFQSELARFHQAQAALAGTNLATDDSMAETAVLDDLINQTLLSQGAVEQGYVANAELLEARINELKQQADLQSWMQSFGFTEQSFRRALQRSIQSAWMRDRILSTVPVTMEQVHARQILLYNSEEANQVYANLMNGADFAQFAALYDPVAAGDLGWFPRGYLTEPEIDQAVFQLQPGEISPIIETRLGFHILQVIERDPQRILEPEAHIFLQSQALQAWLDERRQTGEIQILLP